MPAYWSPWNRGLAALPNGLVGMHAGTVVAEERLRHERHGLSVPLGHVLDDVLEEHDLVGALDQVAEPDVDLGCPAVATSWCWRST